MELQDVGAGIVARDVEHRAGLEGIGTTFIDVDTPGISTPILERLPYTALPRPIFPLDPGLEWTAG